MTTLTEYVVHSGATGSRPMWWEVCPATTRQHAFDVMHHLAELTPEAFGPFGHRRLRVVEKRTEEESELDALSTDELIARSEQARADVDDAMRASRAARLFEPQDGPDCPALRCVLKEHDAHWRMHEDAEGNGWYPGEAPR